MIDVDLPVVIAMRQRLLPPINERQTMLAVDLTDSDWWEQLQLSIQDNEPLLVIMEGVSMYLQAAQMEHILHTVNVFAPSGSKLVLDAFNTWLLATLVGIHRCAALALILCGGCVIALI